MTKSSCGRSLCRCSPPATIGQQTSSSSSGRPTSRPTVRRPLRPLLVRPLELPFLILSPFCCLAGLTGVSLEVWDASTIGASIGESAIQLPSSIITTVLSIVHFLSSQPEVEWIGTAAIFDTANKHASSISQSGVFVPPSHPLWDRNLTGVGQVVSIGDTGVAWSSCFFYDADVPVPFGQLTHLSSLSVAYGSRCLCAMR